MAIAGWQSITVSLRATREAPVRKTKLVIDSAVLKPWAKIARVLGLSLDEYLELYLTSEAPIYRDYGFIEIDGRVSEARYRTRRRAAGVAQRFEKFAVSEQLEGSRCVPIIVAEPVATEEGRWAVEASYLSPHGWESLEWYGGDDESEDGEEWQG
jgi:hypothetical protein